MFTVAALIFVASDAENAGIIEVFRARRSCGPKSVVTLFSDDYW